MGPGAGHGATGRFQLMDLPVDPLTAVGKQEVEVIGGLLGGGVGADMAGVQTVTNGQQIHTRTTP